MDYEYREFSSYKGLDRSVLFLGIPLLGAVFLLTLSVFIMFIGLIAFGVVGILFIFVLLPVGFLFRSICVSDDKAIEMMFLEFKYRFKRVAYKEMGNTLSFQVDRYQRYSQVNEQSFKLMNEVK